MLTFCFLPCRFLSFKGCFWRKNKVMEWIYKRQGLTGNCLLSYISHTKYVFNLYVFWYVCLWLCLCVVSVSFLQAISHILGLMLKLVPGGGKVIFFHVYQDAVPIQKWSAHANVHKICLYMHTNTNTHNPPSPLHAHESSTEVPGCALVQCSVVIINNWPSNSSLQVCPPGTLLLQQRRNQTTGWLGLRHF